MEKNRKSIDSNVKFSWKIKWILAALMLALWSSNFSYSQENDSVKKIDITKLDSYEQFRKNELVRCLRLRERNSVFKMFAQLVSNDTRNWFAEFHGIDEELKNIFSQMPRDENYVAKLDEFLADLDYLYILEKNIECRLAITYMKSRIFDEKLKFLNWNLNANELLKKNLKVWDVILLNKKNAPFDIWTKALKIFDDKYLTDFTHALIFIWFDGDWNILVRHSTTATEKFNKIGVENTMLDSYIFDKDRSGAEWYDIVVLRPDASILQSLLELSEDKIGSWYDNLSALRQWLWLPNTFNDKYNCVELVTQSIKFDESKKVYYWDERDYSFLWQLQRDIENIYIEDLKNEIQRLRSDAFPANILESSLFTNVYLTTINKK